jgi:thiamine-monophosphate kinase
MATPSGLDVSRDENAMKERNPSSSKPLSEHGERALLRDLRAQSASPEVAGPKLLVPIGDDGAVLAVPPGEAAVLTTDTLVEGTHFNRAWTAATDLGFKLVTSAASDIGAMGGRPLAAVIAVTAPAAMLAAELLDLMAGCREAAALFGLSVAGGDTTAGDRLVLTATILGGAPPAALLRRSGARIGDLLVVTGTLGEAGAGLQILRSLFEVDPPAGERWLRAGSPIDEIPVRLRAQGFDAALSLALQGAVRRFLRPTPPLAAGPALAAAGVTAGIDVSDGLASETAWIAAESDVGLALDATLIPIGRGAAAWGAKGGFDPLGLALQGGEDYELLLTVPPAAWPHLRARLAELQVTATAIGEVVPAREGVTLRTADGTRRPLPPGGYEHFRTPS